MNKARPALIVAGLTVVLAGLAFAASSGTLSLDAFVPGSSPPYALSAAGADGNTVWRIDRQGRVSVCGSIASGEGLRSALNDPHDKQVLELTTPRCSAWSSPG